MRMLLLMAVRNLAQGGRRTWLLGVALSSVAFLLTMMLSLVRGVTDNMLEAATTLSSGHVNVSGFFKPAPNDAAPIISETERIREIAAREVNGVDRIIDRHRGWGKIISDTGAIYAGLVGVKLDQEDALRQRLRLAAVADYKEGGGPDVKGDIAGLARHDTTMLFAEQAKSLEVDVGDVVTIRTETLRGQSNTADVTVVAIARDVGLISNWSVFLPTSTILDLYQIHDDTAGAVMIYLDDPERADAVMESLRDVYAAEGFELLDHQPEPFWMKFETVTGQEWTGQKLDLTTWRDEVSYLEWALTAIQTISLLLIAILAAIIAVGVMNAMWIAVRERTREIGTLRALGMNRRRVLALFLIEAGLLGFFSAATGVLAGAAVATGLDAASLELPVVALRAILMSDTLHLIAESGELFWSVVAFTLLTAAASLWPALRAAALRPVTAMHQAE